MRTMSERIRLAMALAQYDGPTVASGYPAEYMRTLSGTWNLMTSVRPDVSSRRSRTRFGELGPPSADRCGTINGAATSASCLLWLALFGHGRPNRQRRGGKGAGSLVFGIFTEPVRRQLVPKQAPVDTRRGPYRADDNSRASTGRRGAEFPGNVTQGSAASSGRRR